MSGDAFKAIEHYARQSGTKPEGGALLSFYKETILPQLIELHERESTGGKAQ